MQTTCITLTVSELENDSEKGDTFTIAPLSPARWFLPPSFRHAEAWCPKGVPPGVRETD